MSRGIELDSINPSDASFLTGEIDDVAIYRNPLTEQAVRARYEAGRSLA